MGSIETAGVIALVEQMDDPRARVALEQLSTRSLARRVGLCENTFRCAFKAVTGRSPQRYMFERRMEQAAGMLAEGDEMIKHIARSIGYNDPYHFSHAFKTIMGMSPSQYRARFRTGTDAF